MPVGKFSKSGTSFSGAAEYDLAQGKYRKDNKMKKPEILFSNDIYSDFYKEIGREFRHISNSNKNCKKPVMKFSISFDPNENISDELKLKFTKMVLLEMGVTDDHQVLITRHSDKEHDHHHIIANRVGLNEKVISDSFAINRLETSIDKVEKILGFENNLASKRRYVYDEKSEKGYQVQLDNFSNKKEKAPTRNAKKGVEAKKKYIQSEVEKALAIAKSLNDLYIILRMNQIEMQMRFNNDKKLTGVSFDYSNLSVKGSALGTKFKASNIDKAVESNFIISKSLKSKEQIFDSEINSKMTDEYIKINEFEKNKMFIEDIARINNIINYK